MRISRIKSRFTFEKQLRQQKRHGFTLVEVLVSMAIITMIVLMVSNMFQDSSLAWDIGVQKSELTTAGRAAIEFMAREISQAVAGPIDSAAQGALTNLVFRQENENEIRFIALSQSPGNNDNRALRDVIFYFNPAPTNKIMVCRNRYKDQCYNLHPDGGWNRSGANPLIGNVNDLQFFVYESKAEVDSGNIPPAARNFYHLPFCVDIFLEIMTDDDDIKVFSTRVYLSNRQGFFER